MYAIFKPITDFFTVIFDMLLNLVKNMGITDEGLQYVLAITFLTILIRVVLLPFNIKSARSTQKMQEVQPEIKKIQEKYKNDPQKSNMELMRVYKENNVSMTGGCLPALLPLPILMALYGVFNNINVSGSFLWIQDLDSHDKLFILPILAALTTFVPSYLMSKSSPSQDAGGMNMGTMNIMMSLMMGFMALRFKSILVIYWIVGGMIQLVTTYFINYKPAMLKKQKVEAVEAEKEASRAPKFVMPDYDEINKKKKKKKR